MNLTARIGKWTKRWLVRRFIYATLDGREVDSSELMRLVSWLWRLTREAEARFTKRDPSRPILFRNKWFVNQDTEQTVVCDIADKFWRMAENVWESGGWDASTDVDKLKLLIRSCGYAAYTLGFDVPRIDRAFLVPKQMAKVQTRTLQVIKEGSLDFWPNLDRCVELNDLRLSSLERGLTSLAEKSRLSVEDLVLQATTVILTLPEDDVRNRETWLAFLSKQDYFDLEVPLDEDLGIVGHLYVLGKSIKVHSARALSFADRSKVQLALMVPQEDYIHTVITKD